MKARAVLLVTTLLVARAAVADASWTRLHEEKGAVVETKKGGGSTLVKTTATLPRPAAAVRAVLLDLERFPSWMPHLHGWRVLSREGETALAYGLHDLPWPFQPRDYVVRYVGQDLGDGTFVLEAKAAPGEGPPPTAGVVRLPKVRSTWRVVPRGADACTVEYTYDSDLAGVPEMLMTSAWKTEGPALLAALSAEVGRRETKAAP